MFRVNEWNERENSQEKRWKLSRKNEKISLNNVTGSCYNTKFQQDSVIVSYYNMKVLQA